MKFELNDHSVAGFAVRMPRGAGSLDLVFGPSNGIHGHIDVDGSTTIKLRTAGHLTVAEVQAPMANGELKIGGPIRAENPNIDVKLGGEHLSSNSTIGTVRIDHLSVALPSPGEIVAEGVIASSVVAQADEAHIRLTTERLAIARLFAPMPEGEITLRGVVLEGISAAAATPSPSALNLAISSIVIDEVAVTHNGASATLKNVRVHDLKSSPEELLRFAHVTVGDLAADVAFAAKEEASVAPPPESASSQPSPLLGFLNAISGTVAADVVAEINLPVVPNWKAKHEVRLKLEGGRVRYKELEASMTRLEDAVLDFNLKDGKLCLDRDIPLVPFDGTTLVSWDLDPDEQADAAAGWVRLERLAQPKVERSRKSTPPPSSKRAGAGTSLLHEVAVQNLALDLSLTDGVTVALSPTARVTLGSGRGTPNSASTLCVRGQLAYRPSGTPVAGQVALSGAGLGALLNGVAVAGHTLNSGIAAKSVSVETELVGVKPRRLGIKVSGVELYDVGLRATRSEV